MKKISDIIQAHRLIFAIAFTLLLIVWFIEPPVMECGFPNILPRTLREQLDCSLSINSSNQFSYSIVIIIWAVLMIWLFRKRKDR